VRARFREGLAKSAKDAKERKQSPNLSLPSPPSRDAGLENHFPTLITTQRGMLQVREKEAAHPNRCAAFFALNTASRPDQPAEYTKYPESNPSPSYLFPARLLPKPAANSTVQRHEDAYHGQEIRP
jgi:hypothetical protein